MKTHLMASLNSPKSKFLKRIPAPTEKPVVCICLVDLSTRILTDQLSFLIDKDPQAPSLLYNKIGK
jgi:hypothetical protein